jgi:hypothetical protein
VTVKGDYTANPTSLLSEPVVGGGLVGATVTLVMEILTLAVVDGGAVDVSPANPVSTTNSGTATGARLDVTYKDGAVKRTYAGVTEPTRIYPAADVTADWGTATPTSIALKVYQVSAIPVIGRGFAQEVTVEVN